MTPLLLLACVGGPTDRDLYLQAAASPSPATSLSLCEAIGDADLRGECATFAAARSAEEGRLTEALEACAPLPPPWDGECAFFVSDAVHLTGGGAIAACDRAASLRFECLAHAADRAARARDDLPDQVGQEQSLVRAIEATTREYLADERPAVINTVSRGIASRIMARRWQRGRFTTGQCGAAERALCTRAYRASIQPWMLEHDVAPLCAAGPPDRAGVEARGLPGWEDGSAEIPLEVWTLVCTDLGSTPGAPQ